MKRIILLCMAIVFMAGMFVPMAAAAQAPAAAAASEMPDGFEAGYAALIEEAGADVIAGMRAHVSVMQKEIPAQNGVLDTLENMDLEITVRLILQGEAIDIEALRMLWEKLAGLGYYAHYSCCAVKDVEKAWELIEAEAFPEEALFASNLMRENAAFDIIKGEIAIADAQLIEKSIIGIPYQPSEGLEVKPYDRYALDMRLTDAAEYEKYFDFGKRLTPVYAFASIGKCRVSIDLAALDLMDADFEVYTLSWDAQALKWRPVRMNYVRGMEKIYLVDEPRFPFCLIADEEGAA